MKILIVGDKDDLSAVYLGSRAKARGAKVVELWEDAFGLEWTFRGREPGFGNNVEIEVGDSVHKGSSFQLVIVRLNPQPAIPEMLEIPTEARPIYLLERRCGISYLLNRMACPVINRPKCGRSNSSKPFQMQFLERAGFRVPKWIITNDFGRARSFIEECPLGAIYKANSGLRARVKRTDEVVLDKFALGIVPLLIQEYIDGCDVRVHVVGSRTFGTDVVSEAVDYRFDDEHTDFRSATVPEDIAKLCVAVAREEGLSLAGFDFRRNSEGQWWCLEVNPVPTFLPYEAGSGQPIGDAILEIFGSILRPGPSVSPLAMISSG